MRSIVNTYYQLQDLVALFPELLGDGFKRERNSIEDQFLKRHLDVPITKESASMFWLSVEFGIPFETMVDILI